MKKKVTLFLILLVVIALASYESKSLYDKFSIFNDSKKNNTIHDINKFKDMGISFDIPYNIPKISPNKALSIASREVDESTYEKIVVEYHLITCTTFRAFSEKALKKNPKLARDQYINKLPAYIVSFVHNFEPNCGPSGYKHELNIIIDAITGEELMGFNYR